MNLSPQPNPAADYRPRAVTQVLRAWSLALIIGGIGFLLATGGKILWPSNIDWLMTGEDDGGTHYLGWEFYRNAPLLQWPFGANPDYGMEISSSIVFSDSLPLFAMALKPFSPWLPRPFQYLGIWLLLCFVLQAYFASRLLKAFGVEGWRAWLGCVFFVMAPSFLFRIWVSHYAGSGHWIVLASLAMYFAPQPSRYGWTALLCVASLVNIYLAVMAGAIYAADLAQRLWTRESRVIPTLRQGVITTVLLLFTMYAAGYFMAGKYTADQGYGYYRLNLLAPVLPMGDWSLWFPSPNVGEGDFEGFNYLGTGVIGLLLAASVLRVRSLSQATKNSRPLAPREASSSLAEPENLDKSRIHSFHPTTTSDWRSRWIPIMTMLVCCTLFGISNRIAAGPFELLAFELPPKLWPICSSFRSSGRFFMPVYYVLFAIGVRATVCNFRAKVGGLILVALLCVQLTDTSRSVAQLHQNLSYAKSWSSPLKSDFWSSAGTQYKSIVVVSPVKHYDGYLPLAHFAVTRRMATNAVYFARVDQQKLQSSAAAISEVVEAGGFAADSIYVFADRIDWTETLKRFPDLVHGADADGFLVLMSKSASWRQ
jgi:hypothetical protein